MCIILALSNALHININKYSAKFNILTWLIKNHYLKRFIEFSLARKLLSNLNQPGGGAYNLYVNPSILNVIEQYEFTSGVGQHHPHLEKVKTLRIDG